jgi:2-polyprenyl-6-methoxyphenol hydroxylase-like FAD-dependent oxidoreductase
MTPGEQRAPETLQTSCCVVGGGPAGVLLSLLLARAGVPVVLLEARKDFDRDFRGDTIHPSTLEVLDQIGLADRLHQLPHAKMRELRFITPARVYSMAVFSRLPTRFPYVMIMPQSRFLEFLVAEAKRYPHFRIVMDANVQQLIEEQGVVRGVAYRGADGPCELRAGLTVAADGRFSRLRKLAGLEGVSQSAPMEVIWLRLPRKPRDPGEEGSINIGHGRVIALLGRVDEWQVGYIVAKGGYQKLKRDGIETLHKSIADLVPWLADRVGTITDWHDINVLSVEADRLTRWHRPGLMIIGDAAHVMLPVGGVGINCAIADAVEAANVLAQPLRAGRLEYRHLIEVQRRRERYTQIVQRFQRVMQKRGLGETLEAAKPFSMPLPLRIVLRIPGLRDLPPRVMAFGVRRARLERPDEVPASQ